MDWQLFTRAVAGGARVRRAQGVVADYRQYSANTLGIGGYLKGRMIEAQMIAARGHFAALKDMSFAEEGLARIDHVERALMEQRPTNVLERLNGSSEGLWFDWINKAYSL